jgi:ribosomal-protein-alanine N-acetyltransferase
MAEDFGLWPVPALAMALLVRRGITPAMLAEPHFTQGPFILRRPRTADAAALAAFQARNAEHFRATSPRRADEFFSQAFWSTRIALADRNFQEDGGVALYVFHEAQGAAVGMVNLMNFVRGALQGCDLGYAIDAAHQGTGLMYWAVQQALGYAFGALRLHRVQANHLPENQRSARLLARLGFRREGYAERFLLIDGRWRDHVLNALVHDAWQPEPAESYVLAGADP